MKTTEQSALPLLVQAAFADAHFKVMQGIWQMGFTHCGANENELDSTVYPSKWGTTKEHAWDRNHPYWRACDEARELCVELGRFCRKHDLDPTPSPLVDNLAFKDSFFESFEKGRLVLCAELTPSVIHDCVEKRNVLRWEDWTITAGKLDFSTDDYGQDEYIRPLIATHESGANEICLWMAGHPKGRARQAYKLLTGFAYTGEDTLGDDARHFMDPDGCDFYHIDPDSDYGQFEDPYELTDEDHLDLMVLSAKLEISDMCCAALDLLSDEIPAS